ncbi:MAG: phosphate ABC transporter, permease protein PstA, partial [Nitrososphaeraceae archaeon]
MHEKTTAQKSNTNQKIQDIMSRHYYRRRLVDKIVSAFAITCVLAAIIPLGSILLEVIKNGASAISIQLLTQPPGAIGSTLEDSGGIAPAIQGTLIVVGLASAI